MEERGPVIGEPEISAFEQRFGYRLPEDYRRFLLEINGGWLAPENTRLQGYILKQLFSLANKDNLSSDLETRACFSRDRQLVPHPDLLLIGRVDGGSILLALDGEHRGEVWCLDTVDPRPEGSNPRVLWHDRRDMEKLADSFEQLVAKLQPVK